MDIIINEYSNSDTTDGDAMIYAENIHKNAIDAASPKNNINFQV
jgi:hypothetical protein